MIAGIPLPIAWDVVRIRQWIPAYRAVDEEKGFVRRKKAETLWAIIAVAARAGEPNRGINMMMTRIHLHALVSLVRIFDHSTNNHNHQVLDIRDHPVIQDAQSQTHSHKVINIQGSPAIQDAQSETPNHKVIEIRKAPVSPDAVRVPM